MRNQSEATRSLAEVLVYEVLIYFWRFGFRFGIQLGIDDGVHCRVVPIVASVAVEGVCVGHTLIPIMTPWIEKKSERSLVQLLKRRMAI